MTQDLTPREAREQLVTSQARSLTTRRDRRIHATVTAAFGRLLRRTEPRHHLGR
jgi:hypothetical protein